MRFELLQTYKSLSPFTWQDIPEFAVVTGINGSGKTQLLEAIETSSSLTHNKPFRLDFGVLAPNLSPHEILRIEATWHNLTDLAPISIGDVQSEADHLWTQWQSFVRKRERSNRPQSGIFQEFERLAAERDPASIDRNGFMRAMSEFVMVQHGEIFNSKFANICQRHELRRIDRLRDNVAPDEAARLGGTPPWTVLNEMLKAANLQFRVTDPTETSSYDKYHCRLVDTSNNKDVQFSQLSSGEQILVSLVFWLFNASDPTIFPRLLLLDEPDAHLHPKMVKQFLDVIRETIVDRQGVKVIMTSHSPSTIALVPEQSLFEMHRTGPVGVSREVAIAQLTAGLVVVRPGIRFILVEDDADVVFYSDTLAMFAAASAAPIKMPLAFVSAGKKSGESSGGRREVEKWVEKLSDLTEIRGLVDRDGNPTSIPRVRSISRYCIENYLCDPLIVFAALIAKRISTQVEGVEIQFGDEHKISSLPPKELRAIVDKIEGKAVSNSNGELISSSTKTNVSYINGAKCELSSWNFTVSGKSILRAYQNAFGGHVINKESLRAAYQRTKLVASEFEGVFTDLQRTH